MGGQFDFELKLTVELTNPIVRRAYQEFASSPFLIVSNNDAVEG